MYGSVGLYLNQSSLFLVLVKYCYIYKKEDKLTHST